ncbi:hypothetical protein Trydic_g20674 [Trypoxylus dichotomus]
MLESPRLVLQLGQTENLIRDLSKKPNAKLLATSIMTLPVPAILFGECTCYIEEISNVEDGCLEALSLEESELVEFRNAQQQGIEPTHNGKCIATCAMQVAGFISEDGGLNEDAIQRSVHNDSIIEFGLCKDVIGSDDCDKYYKMSQCVISQLAYNGTV